MEDQGEGEMNLDLNLGPLSPASGGSAPGNGTASLLEENNNLNDSVGIHPRYREALRQRTRQIWRRRGWGNIPVPLETQVTSPQLVVDSRAAADPVAVGHDINGIMHTGEGSNDTDVRSDELTKVCENIVTQPEDETADMKKDIENGITGDGSSFFDCNICLDIAKEPIVTSCGHLFCWPCLYRWLNIHSDAKECPVCKGEVTVKTVTPIFGKGDATPNTGEDHGVKIPDRPPARRVESLRQAIQRTALSIPMEEMIRRLGMRFDHTRDSLQDPHMLERSAVLLNRILTSRGLRREQNVVAPSSDGEDLNLESEETRPEMAAFSHLFHRRRSQSYRGSPPRAVPPSGASADRFVETVIRTPSVDDRDSISSITAAIHGGESQTVDTAAEIDSTVSLSTSSSRRRNDASRISDMDSGDSPMPRRRRIN